MDSTALLRLAVEAGCDVAAVHVDHGLRPDSSQDGAFVAELARALGVPCRIVPSAPAPGNVQAEARAARYAALAEAAALALGCDAVATAHTADDQAETLLLALVRGAGLRGLAGDAAGPAALAWVPPRAGAASPGDRARRARRRRRGGCLDVARRCLERG